MFSCVPFGIKGWITVVLLAATMIPVDMVRKAITKLVSGPAVNVEEMMDKKEEKQKANA